MCAAADALPALDAELRLAKQTSKSVGVTAPSHDLTGCLATDQAGVGSVPEAIAGSVGSEDTTELPAGEQNYGYGALASLRAPSDRLDRMISRVSAQQSELDAMAEAELRFVADSMGTDYA